MIFDGTFGGVLKLGLVMLSAAMAGRAIGQPMQPVLSLAQKERPALLETLKELTAIESGSREPEELDKIANVLAAKLRALGGKVELIEPVEANTHRLSDTPQKLGKMVRATFTGSGTKKILLLAHMDTVYPRGMLAQQPFRIDGDRVRPGDRGRSPGHRGDSALAGDPQGNELSRLRHDHGVHQRG